jgi:hypothetical protein
MNKRQKKKRMRPILRELARRARWIDRAAGLKDLHEALRLGFPDISPAHSGLLFEDRPGNFIVLLTKNFSMGYVSHGPRSGQGV